MKRCFIFAAGSFYGLRECPQEGDRVIAADAGYLHCQALGIRPDLLVGDFDSMELPQGVKNVLQAPVEKDDTDTILAVKEGLKAGCDEFFIYGGTGGKRMDHSVANLQTLLYLRRRGARGFLYDQDFVWTVIENESIEIPRTVDWGLLSVFAMGEEARGVTETGVQYPLTKGTIKAAYPYAVSNHLTDDCARVLVKDGALLVGWELPIVVP